MVKVFDSPFGKELTFFFVTGIVNEEQRDYVAEEINILAEQEIEGDKLVISALLNQKQFERFNGKFEDLGFGCRGRAIRRFRPYRTGAMQDRGNELRRKTLPRPRANKARMLHRYAQDVIIVSEPERQGGADELRDTSYRRRS
jgi:hypothetical protein